MGVSSVADGSARKRSSAARDLPEAGGPVIKREVASSQYPVAGSPNSAGAYWLLAAGYWLLLIMAWGLIAAWDLLEAGGLVIKKEVASSQYPVVRTAQVPTGYWLLATSYYGLGANCGGISLISF